MPTIFHVQTSTFAGFDPDAFHYLVKLTWHENGKYKSEELEHPISTKEAIGLNKSDRGPLWKKGDLSNRFDSEKSAIRFAIEEFWKRSKFGDILLKGNSASGDPQKILAGPTQFVLAANRLYKKAVAIDHYEREPDKMDGIYREWVALLKQFNLS